MSVDGFVFTEGPLSKEIRGMNSRFHYSVDIVARMSFYYTVFRAARLIASLRKPPKNIAIRVNTLNMSPEKVLDKIRESGIEIKPSRIFEDVLLVKVEGPFKVTMAEKRVVAKDKSAEGVYMGANLYMPGVLRMDSDIKVGDPVNVVNRFGDVVGYGVSQVSSGEKGHRGAVVEIKESPYKAPNLKTLRAFILGDAYVASLGTTQALRWLAPAGDEKILCVSPNVEDLVYLIQLVGGPSENIAVVSKTDLEEYKLREGLRKMKLEKFENILRFYVIDYRRIKFPPKSFDAMYITPRNSKIGIRPRLSATITENEILAYSRDIKGLLDNLIPSLNDEGRLLFNTFSLDPAEGEFIVKYLVETWGLEPVVKRYRWGAPGIRDIPHGDKTLRVYPDIHDDHGYFAALMVNKGG
ncbi:MAG: PUA domain-containing protein [Candidatus Njordarchaeia archaeon]